MKVVACYNVWDDDANLRLSLESISNHITDVQANIGPYKHFPLFEGQILAIENNRTQGVFNTWHQRNQHLGLSIERNADKVWESEIEKRNAYFYAIRKKFNIIEEDIWAFIIDSDEIFAPETFVLLKKLNPPPDVKAIALPIVDKTIRNLQDVRLPIRLVRMDPSVHYEKTHYIIFRDDKLLRPDLVLWDMPIMHLVGNREKYRIAQADTYYKTIVDKGLEQYASYMQLIKLSEGEY